MKNTLFVPLLTLSAALNVILAFYPFTPAESVNGHPNPTAATTPASQSQAIPPNTVVWTTPKAPQDLPDIIANLRNAGFPPSTVRAAVNQLLKDRYDPASLLGDLPFWKFSYPGTEIISAQQKMSDEKTAIFEALLGSDARPSAMMSPIERQQRFGNLPDDKVDAITRIEKDYLSIGTLAYAEARGDMSISMEQRRTLEQEKLADLQATLTPDQLEQYQMRNSSSAQAVIRSTTNLDLSETEYTALYQARKQFDDQTPALSTGTYSAEQMAQRAANQQALTENARATLGDDRFYTYLAKADSNYGRLAQLSVKFPSVTPAVSYQLYQLQNEAQQAMRAANIDRSIPSGARNQATQALMAGYVEKLNSLISPEVAAAYEKTPHGMMFATFKKAISSAPGNTN